MKYNMWKLYTSREGLELCVDLLMAQGLEGMVIDDPADVDDLLNKKNDYDWDYVAEEIRQQAGREPAITLYFDETEQGRAELALAMDCVAQLRKRRQTPGDVLFGLPLGRLQTELFLIDDQDWKDKWKEYFKPAHITERIVVKPSWEEYEPDAADELVIEIDPGMAFGTGTHPTTALCVALLERYIQSPEDAVLDVGCGSGILSMASALLGVKSVVGVEIDPVAVEVAKENIKRNGLEQRVQVIEGDLTQGLSVTADIVAANLMADLVIRLSKDVAKHLRGRGIYISSGILVEKKESVASAIEESGFEILEILERDEWCAIAAQLRRHGDCL